MRNTSPPISSKRFLAKYKSEPECDVNGAAQASDSVLTTALVEMKWMNGWFAATFEGEFSNATSRYARKRVVRYQW
jgi:hypothetical protein